MIEAIGLTKRYGSTVAVDDLSFKVEPGTVTGFLGPNGAGKSTTMRMILGLDNPTKGKALIFGRVLRAPGQTPDQGRGTAGRQLDPPEPIGPVAPEVHGRVQQDLRQGGSTRSWRSSA